MPEIKLIAADLDGTLLDSEKKLSEKNLKALEQAAAEGIEFVPATGRFFSGMPECIRALPFINYAITVNGASVFDIKNGKTVCASEIPWEKALEIFAEFDKYDAIYDCYMDNWGWMTESFYNKADRYAANIHSLKMIRELRTPVKDLKTHISNTKHGIQKVQLFFKDLELRSRAMNELKARFPDMEVTTSIVNNIEINSKEATKGNALKLLAEFIGVDVSKTVAFGDDFNDISMLRTAGIGFAMANAAPEVRSAADRIAAGCDESGVGKAIEELLRRM